MGTFEQVVTVEHSPRVWVISDLHLEDGATAKIQAFFHLLDRALSSRVPVVCGGDFFQLFLGWPHCQTPLQHTVFQALRTFRARGGRFYWVRGNRDFRPEYWAAAVDGVADILTGSVGKHRWSMVHGHGLNRWDWTDWIWQRIVHHPAALRVLGWVPPVVLKRVAMALERRLRRFPSPYKRVIPWLHLRRHLECVWSQAPSRWLLVGHFHVFARWREETSEGEREVIFVPAWDKEPAYIELQARGVWRLCDVEGRPMDRVPLEPFPAASLTSLPRSMG